MKGQLVACCVIEHDERLGYVALERLRFHAWSIASPSCCPRTFILRANPRDQGGFSRPSACSILTGRGRY